MALCVSPHLTPARSAANIIVMGMRQSTSVLKHRNHTFPTVHGPFSATALDVIGDPNTAIAEQG
jgi:hypothetical protein